MPGHGGKPRTLARTISRTSYDWSLSWVFAPFLLIIGGGERKCVGGGEEEAADGAWAGDEGVGGRL